MITKHRLLRFSPWLLFGLALAVRLVAAFGLHLPWLNVDSAAYAWQARSIVAGEPSAFFPNGYPIAIAAVMVLVPQAHLVTCLVGLNVFLSALCPVLCYHTARSLEGRVRDRARGDFWAVALVSGVVVALWPNQINYARFVLSEPLATASVLLATWLTLRRRDALAGLVWAWAALVRYTLLPVLPLVAVLLLVTQGIRRAVRFAAGCGAVLVLHALLVSAGVLDAPASQRLRLLVAISATSSEGLDFQAREFGPEAHAAPVATYARFAAEHPVRFLEQRASSLWELWGPWPSAGNGSRSLFERALIGLRFPLLVLALAGLWRCRQSWEAWVPALPILVVTGVHVAFFSEPRFTVPVEPGAVLLAVWALAGLVRRYDSHKNGHPSRSPSARSYPRRALSRAAPPRRGDGRWSSSNR